MAIDLTQAPYNDDFQIGNKYYRILFRPSRAVQARELTQIQSQIQSQFEKIGSHLFKQGAQILPGSADGIVYNNNVGFITVDISGVNVATREDLENYWLGKIIMPSAKLDPVTGENLGVEAKVIGFKVANSHNVVRLFLSYTKSSTFEADVLDGKTERFQETDVVIIKETPQITAQISGTNPVGMCSSVTVEEGVYYYDEFFVYVEKQTLFVEPSDPEDSLSWTNQPTATIGILFSKDIRTFEEDESLLDNARNTPNYSAPGADRLYISGDIHQYRQAVEGFYPYIKVDAGEVVFKVSSTQYSVIMDTLARRTYDESGDYALNPFIVEVKEFLRDDLNNGVHYEYDYAYTTQEEADEASVEVFGLSVPNSVEFGGLHYPGTTYNDEGDETSFISLCKSMMCLKIEKGKAYVKGYEIEKLGNSIVNIKRPRSSEFIDNAYIPTPLGQYYIVEDIQGFAGFNEQGIVDLYRDFDFVEKIGTARVLAASFITDGEYKLYIYDIDITDDDFSSSDVRSISNAGFSCKVIQSRFSMQGTVTGSGTTITGTNGTTFWQTDEMQKLSAGQVVEIEGQIRIIDSVVSDEEFEITQALAPDVVNPVGMFFLYSMLRTDTVESGLLYSMPSDKVRSLRGITSQGNIDDSVIDSTFRVLRQVYTNEPDVGGVLSYNLVGDNDSFLPVSRNSYFVIKNNTEWQEVVSGNAPIGGKAVVNISGQIATFYLDAGHSYTIVAGVLKTGGNVARERAKELRSGRFIGGSYDGESVVASAGKNKINLGRTDIKRVTRIVESPDNITVPSSAEVLPQGHRNITGAYVLNNGQRDFYYGEGFVELRSGYPEPTGQIRVEFDYFFHDGSKGYYTVDSYDCEYKDIPSYTSSDGSEYDLCSCIDWRPDFIAGNIANDIPYGDFRCDYHYYNARIDKLYLDKTGEFKTVTGLESGSPETPPNPLTGMVIAEIGMPPYTAFVETVSVKRKNNRRYTMQDIIKIDNRVKNLEEYTTLSLLEKNTNDMLILDSQGRNRFKNGFMVDNFTSFNVCDLSNAGFAASIHKLEQECRPLVYESNVSMVDSVLLLDSAMQEDRRTVLHHSKSGEIYMLPYEESVLEEQSVASSVSNVNPYNSFAFSGTINLSPWSDEWRDTIYSEPLNVFDSSQWEAMSSGFGATGTRIDGSATSINFLGTKLKEGKLDRRNDADLTVMQLNSRNASVKKYTQQLVAAGHRLKTIESLIKKGKIIVPPGFKNSGQIVPLGDREQVKGFVESTITTKSQSQTSTFTSSFVDMGFSNPVNIGERIIDTSVAEFIRSREVSFSGKCFKPGVRLYPFFDDVDVSLYCSPEGGVYGDKLIANELGEISGVFSIPNADGMRFRTGIRRFKLTASSTNREGSDSEGSVDYLASGFIDTKQQSTLSTRLYKIDTNSFLTLGEVNVTKQKVITERVCPRDPIAQTFYVKERNGCFLTSVEIFFERKPVSTSPQIPVTLQIRNTSPDGSEIRPGINLLPFGEVVKNVSEIVTNIVNLDTNKIIINGVEQDLSESPSQQMQSTKFVFESPIYLEGQEYYSFVLLSDSDEYTVWIVDFGQDSSGAVPREIGTNKPIQKDAYVAGTFFQSSNGLTWTENQVRDIKFKLNKAKFDISQSGRVEFVNLELPMVNLTWKPFESLSGSSKLSVLHPNHGYGVQGASKHKIAYQPISSILTGTVVSVSTNVTGTDTKFLSELVVNGMLINPVTKECRRIASIVSDTSLTLVAPYTLGEISGNCLGTSYPVDVEINGIPMNKIFCADGFEVGDCGVDGYDIEVKLNTKKDSFVEEIEEVSGNYYLRGSDTQFRNDLIIGSKVLIDGDIVTILSIIDDENATIQEAITKVSGNYDAYIVATDSGRFEIDYVMASENKRFDEITLLTTPLQLNDTSMTWTLRSITGSGIDYIEKQPYRTELNQIIPNERLYMSNPMAVSSYINEYHSGSPVVGPSPISDIGDRKSLKCTVRLQSKDENISPVIDSSRFSAFLSANILNDVEVDEEENFDIGKSAARYITKKMYVARPSTALRVMFDGFRSENCDIDLYYRTSTDNSGTPLNNKDWIKMPYLVSDNEGQYIESISPAGELRVYEANAIELQAFTICQVKVVMKGGNPARCPFIKNFRMIVIDE